MNIKEELKIVEQVKKGDLLSFRLLVDKYKNMAYHIAIQIVRSSLDAEEIIQDAFLKAYQSINTFKGNSKFSTWFYRIVYNLAITKTRKKKIDTSNIDDVQLSDAEIRDSYNAFEALAKKERTAQLKSAINKLNDDEALVISLYYLNENSVEEINEITKFSISNIKVKLHRARKKLFVILSDVRNTEINVY